MNRLTAIILYFTLFILLGELCIGKTKSVELTSSNLPIVVINTNGQAIQDEPRIVAEMGIIYNPDGTRNYLVDPFNEYHGRISIEIRGKTSQQFPKKSYGLETQDVNGENLNVSLLGMPEENDWILYAPYSDKSLLRNVLSFYLARAMGQYASRTNFCELIINGYYKGIYIFMEKIKRDNNRVNIAKLYPDEISGDDLTGGYIIKVDEFEGEERGWYSYHNSPNTEWKPIYFKYYYPESDEIVPEQKDYIKSFILDFELALTGDDFTDPETGYQSFIDVSSFIDHFIINELAENIDGYRRNTFIYKDKESKDGKLTMGPIWDFNLGYGNYYDTAAPINTDGWMYNNGGKRMYWWVRMMQDNGFKNKLKSRWTELRRGPFRTDSISVFLENMSSYINEAQERNFDRWSILGQYVWPNDYIGQSYLDELTYLENWIINRLNWVDNNIPGKYINASINNQIIEFHIYPNPFSSLTNVKYELNSTGQVTITIYNILGRKIRTLVNTYQPKGGYNTTWNGKDDFGNSISNGIYLYSVKINGYIATKGKIIRIKSQFSQ